MTSKMLLYAEDTLRSHRESGAVLKLNPVVGPENHAFTWAADLDLGNSGAYCPVYSMVFQGSDPA